MPGHPTGSHSRSSGGTDGESCRRRFVRRRSRRGPRLSRVRYRETERRARRLSSEREIASSARTGLGDILAFLLSLPKGTRCGRALSRLDLPNAGALPCGLAWLLRGSPDRGPAMLVRKVLQYPYAWYVTLDLALSIPNPRSVPDTPDRMTRRPSSSTSSTHPQEKKETNAVSTIRFIPEILRAVQEMHYTTPTPFRKRRSPVLQERTCSAPQTGTGKTAPSRCRSFTASPRRRNRPGRRPSVARPHPDTGAASRSGQFRRLRATHRDAAPSSTRRQPEAQEQALQKGVTSSSHAGVSST